MVKFQSIELNRLVSMKSGEAITAQHIDNYGEYPCFGGNGLRGYTNKYTHNGAFALIGRQGALCGNVTYVNGLFFASEHAVVVTPKEDNIIKYIYYVLDAMHLNQYVESSAQPGLSVNKLLNLLAYVSTDSNEQKRIAAVLADIDELISSLETLIAKKKVIKQGAMQELLTGKKRLPGFSGEWKEYFLSDICQLVNGRAYSQDELLSSGKYCVLRLGNLFTNEHWYYSDLELPEKQYCSKGDLIYAWSGTFGPHIWNGEKVIYHYHIWRVDLNALACKEYVYHYLRADVQSLMAELQGGTMAHLTKESMEKRTIMMPEYNEQVAIAETLSNMDSEIEALEQKLAKYCQIKQGMMQQLLTGKIRLV